MRILVTGATGTVGRHLVSQLDEADHQVRALTRNPALARNPAGADFPSGVEVVAGDVSDAGTLEAAFSGVDAVHLITFGGDGYDDLTNGPELVALAERNGVRRVTILGGWSPTSVEEAVTASGLEWTILQPKEFMGNALEWADEIRAKRAVSMLATYPSAMVHEADIAAVAVSALVEGGHGGRSYELTGPEALTPMERTRILAEATGQEIAFVQLTEEQERDRLRSYGYDEGFVEFGIQLATSPPDIAGIVVPTVEEVAGRPARTFASWAREHAGHFRAQ